MELSVAIRLIKEGIDQTAHAQRWADLGAGNGLFTHALASLLPPKSEIHTIDCDAHAINAIRLNNAQIKLVKAVRDLGTEGIGVDDLDGVLMANALHFLKEQVEFLKTIHQALKPNGRLLLIEYDMEFGNKWVPYPISFRSIQKLAADAGFVNIQKMDEEPSIYNRANMYSAALQRQ